MGRVTDFDDDFEDVLKRVSTFILLLVIMGDINIHRDVKDETNILKFIKLLESNGLVQHVFEPTQCEGHTRDILIMCTDVTPMAILIEEPSLFDHSFIVAEMALQIDRGQPVVSVVKCRNWRNFDIDSVSADLATSKVIADPPSIVTELFACYNDTLRSLTNMRHLSKC